MQGEKQTDVDIRSFGLVVRSRAMYAGPYRLQNLSFNFHKDPHLQYDLRFPDAKKFPVGSPVS